MVSVVPYSWMSAKDMAESKRGAGISKVVDEGRYEVNGVIYYYYAYSVLHIKGEKRSCTYHFAAYADLKMVTYMSYMEMPMTIRRQWNRRVIMILWI